MSEIKLVAKTRTEFGKGAARRIRRENKIPAVLYGHGSDPVHVTLPGHATMLAVRSPTPCSPSSWTARPTLAVTKDVQRDAVNNTIEHVDLLIVSRGEKVTVDVPVNIVGESAPGTIHVVEAQTLSARGRGHAPARVGRGLDRGSRGRLAVTAGEVALPEGSTLLTDPERPRRRRSASRTSPPRTRPPRQPARSSPRRSRPRPPRPPRPRAEPTRRTVRAHLRSED